ESDPTNADEHYVDPFYVTAMQIEEEDIVHRLGVDDNFRLTITATFEHGGLIFEGVDISRNYDLLEVRTSDSAVVTASFDGLFTPHEAGEVELEVIFIEKGFSATVPLEVTAQPGLPDLSAANRISASSRSLLIDL